MADNQVLVILLRRDESELKPEEVAAVKNAFPGKEVVFKRTDPRDYKKHAAQCEKLRPAAVILPLERPIPSLAMERGFQHVAITPNGLMELEPLVPSFKPFAPRQ